MSIISYGKFLVIILLKCFFCPNFLTLLIIDIFTWISSFFIFYPFYFFTVPSLPTFSDWSFNYLDILIIDILRLYLITSLFDSLVHLYLLHAFSLNFQLRFVFLYAWLFCIEFLTLKKYFKALSRKSSKKIMLLFRQVSRLGML